MNKEIIESIGIKAVEVGKRTVKEKVRKFIIILMILIGVSVTIGIGAGVFAYISIKGSVKYEQKQAENIALEQVKGIILECDKKIKGLTMHYEFEIKDKNNDVYKVLVSAEDGTIIKTDRDLINIK